MIELVADHVWQSTLVAAAAGLLTLALRRNRAQIRYLVSLAASIKFVVPFAALAALTPSIEWRPFADGKLPAIPAALDIVSQRFTQAWVAAVPPSEVVTDSTSFHPTVVILIWLAGIIVLLTRWAIESARIAALVRRARPRQPANPTQSQLQAMRRALLAERFQLAVRTEQRELDVYALVSAPAGGARRSSPARPCFRAANNLPPQTVPPGETPSGFRLSAGHITRAAASRWARWPAVWRPRRAGWWSIAPAGMGLRPRARMDAISEAGVAGSGGRERSPRGLGAVDFHRHSGTARSQTAIGSRIRRRAGGRTPRAADTD